MPVVCSLDTRKCGIDCNRILPVVLLIAYTFKHILSVFHYIITTFCCKEKRDKMDLSQQNVVAGKGVTDKFSQQNVVRVKSRLMLESQQNVVKFKR